MWQYRAALALFLLCGFALYRLVVWMGMPPTIAVAFFALFFMVAFSVTRIRAEVGPPSHSMLYVNPQDILITTLGSASLSPQTLTLFSILWWFNRLNRNHPMPAALESFRIAEVVSVSRVKMWVLMWLVVALSIVSAFLIYPALFYKDGAVKAAGEVLAVGRDTFNKLDNWLQDPKPRDWTGMTIMAGGFGLAMLLGVMRTRFLWWTLHPMGYALGMSYAVDFYWVSLVVASTLKWVLIRYGGAAMYRKALPFFFGLIMGECIVACSWSIYGLIIHKPTYDAWW